MKYIVDHDFHIHSTISPCCHDENQTPETILNYAKENNFKAVCLTNHLWDENVKSVECRQLVIAGIECDELIEEPSEEDLIAELEKARRKTFTETLMWYIAKTGKTDSAIYNSALMDRRLFSKIMSDRNYKPSKDTAVALVLALHLNLEQAEDLLKRAGYSLSHSNKRDIVIEYFIREEVYDLMVINDVLHKLEEKKIGR